MVAVEFGVLGSIEARVDGRSVELGHARQRLLLAALLLDVNREVPTGQLAERLWGKDHAQRGTLYGYLSRLRKALAGVEGVEIARRSAGYALVADPRTVDVCRFRDLAERARATQDDKQAAELFERALDLWRGEALTGADTPWVTGVREGLRQERLAVELDRVEVRLRLGQHAGLLAGLHGLTREYPQDERLAGQLMLALYRCGRTTDALGHYQATQRALGIEPGPELQRLHQRILTGDPALTPEAEGTMGSDSVQVPVPRQLPAPPALFTGRSRELERLSAVLEERPETGGTVVISAIGGVGGIGKTYLALHWAHRHLEEFPDGQLYVNLRGFGPSGEPLDPSAAVCAFLEALGVASAAIPGSLDAQSALYRSLVAGRRMLVVLDNARDTDQAAPLVPGSPTCTVLVTSRNQLTALTTTHAARPLPLDALPETEARALLARHLGENRLTAEPEATAALLAHCAGLPLALSIIAARAAAQPGLPLADLAEELAETATRLDALDTGELTANLRAVFDSSHRALPHQAARAFALLGLAPGPDTSLHAAANLLGHSTVRARTLLRTLETAHLLQQHTTGRYRTHDLVRLYAAEHARRGLDEPAREAALRRLVDFYLHTAHHAGLAIYPQLLFPVDLDPPTADCTPHRPTSVPAALDWYRAEHACLIAVQRLTADLDWHTLAWRLAHTLFSCQWYGSYFRDGLVMGRVALTAAGQLPGLHPTAVAHSLLGFVCGATLQLPEAFDHLKRALTLFEQTEDLPGQAFTHWGLASAVGWSYGNPDPRRGLHHAKRAAELFHTAGNTSGESRSLGIMCRFHALLDEHEQARACGEQALALARPLGLPAGEAWALITLGFALHRSGDYTGALVCHHQAITMYRATGGTYWEALALSNLGYTRRALGQTAEGCVSPEVTGVSVVAVGSLP